MRHSARWRGLGRRRAIAAPNRRKPLRRVPRLARNWRARRSVLGGWLLGNVPELLEDLLDRLHAARSVAGDAHGKPPGAADVPQEVADLAVYAYGAAGAECGDVALATRLAHAVLQHLQRLS